ncbi:MAG TPA: hypothetical protein VLA79_00855 [Polyangia bacterium]|jgi:hypothetical protein|nr:hypothetical protein [Polyangia bacterium]
MSTDVAKGPPLFGLPFGGVAFGALWIAGAFATLFYCFASNYINKASVPAEELAIANAALSPAADHHATP